MLSGGIFIRASETQLYSGASMPAPPRINLGRAAGYLAVISLGLFIGYVLGVLAALVSGLIMLC